MNARRAVQVVMTTGDGAAVTLAAVLRDAGAEVRMLPVVIHEPADGAAELDAALVRLAAYSWVAFTSARAVDAAAARPAWISFPWSATARPRVAAVGPITRDALERSGARVDLCPDVPGARALGEAIVAAEHGSMAGHPVLWPRADIARPELMQVLTEAGAAVDAPVAYCTRPNLPAGHEAIVADLAAGRVDCVVFLSPSAAANLASLLPGATLASLAGSTCIASVGPTTSAALAALGASANVEAPARTAGDLAAALLSYFEVSGRLRP